MSSRTRQLALVAFAAALAGLALPAAAQAATTPVALLGIDVGDLVEDLIRGLVDLVIPDFAADWVSELVTWLVAVPTVGDWSHYRHLNGFRRELVGVGYALLALSMTVGLLPATFGSTTHAADTLKRTFVGAAALSFYPVFLNTTATLTNLLTASMIRHPDVVDGLDKALGAALVLGAVTGGISLGLMAGAAMAVAYFIAALIVMKVGLTAASRCSCSPAR